MGSHGVDPEDLLGPKGKEKRRKNLLLVTKYFIVFFVIDYINHYYESFNARITSCKCVKHSPEAWEFHSKQVLYSILVLYSEGINLLATGFP